MKLFKKMFQKGTKRSARAKKKRQLAPYESALIQLIDADRTTLDTLETIDGRVTHFRLPVTPRILQYGPEAPQHVAQLAKALLKAQTGKSVSTRIEELGEPTICLTVPGLFEEGEQLRFLKTLSDHRI